MEHFYLGTHRTSWLERVWKVPIMLSYRQLFRVPRANMVDTTWALDSGGFSELTRNYSWKTRAYEYATSVAFCQDEVPGFQWATIQDWMCEPAIRARTGLSVAEHQARTVASYLELRKLQPEVRWLPVLQGWETDDYLRHLDAYAAAGVQLTELPLVGVGTLCRRRDDARPVEILSRLAGCGLRLHAFGVKLTVLRQVRDLIVSADSKAWSVSAWRRPGNCPDGLSHSSCVNCLGYALRWYDRVLEGR